jgi:hypothetical protein
MWCAGLVSREGEDRIPNDAFSRIIKQFKSPRDAIIAALKSSRLGQGGNLFHELVSAAFHVHSPAEIRDLDDHSWQSYADEVRSFFTIIEKWDRKFLNIQILAELFLVKDLLQCKQIHAPNSWAEYLLKRARMAPEELTVHVNRFGKTEFLRLF